MRNGILTKLAKTISFVGRAKFDTHLNHSGKNLPFGHVSSEIIETLKAEGELIKRSIGGSVTNTCLDLDYLVNQKGLPEDRLPLIHFYAVLGKKDGQRWLDLTFRKGVTYHTESVDLPFGEVILIHTPGNDKINVAYNYGASGNFHEVLSDPNSCDIFYTSLFEASLGSESFMSGLVRKLKLKSNPCVWLNLGGLFLDRDDEELYSILHLSDVLIGNEKEFRLLGQKGLNIEDLFRHNISTFITYGKYGTELITPTFSRIRSYPMEGGPFSLGAGDVFAAALLYSYISGESFFSALQFANTEACRKTHIDSSYLK